MTTATIQAAVAAFVARCGNAIFHVTKVSYEPDDYGTYRQIHGEYNVEQLATDLLEHTRWRDQINLEELKSVDDLIGLIIDDHDDCHVIIETPEENKKREAEEERQRLEQAAQQFCQRNNVRPGTMELLEALDRELERLESYREGMREDGLCIGYGVTHEQWCEEHNESVSDTHNIRAIFDWVANNCPLLFAQYQEAKLG